MSESVLFPRISLIHPLIGELLGLLYTLSTVSRYHPGPRVVRVLPSICARKMAELRVRGDAGLLEYP